MSAHLGHAQSLLNSRPSRRQAGWPALIRRMFQIVESRQDLQELDERMLRDVGITRQEALAEANRAPWDLTPYRKPRGPF